MDRLVVPVLSLGASAVIADLRAQVPSEVVAVIVDVGGLHGLDGLRDAMLAAGARRCHIVDVREAVVARACWPALAAGALGVPGPPLESALALPAVASAVVDVAGHESATAVVPWAEDPADRQRLRALVRSLAPSLGLVSMASTSRAARSANLWARVEAVEDLAAVATPRAQSAMRAAEVRIGFAHGVPQELNGVTMTPVELIDSLRTILDDHGVGPAWVRAVSGPGGWRVEAPAARVLHEALASVTARLYDAATAEVAATVAEAYADVVRDGTWFAPLRHALDGFVERATDAANAAVAVRITGGRIEVQA